MRRTPIPKHGTEVYRLESPKVETDLAIWTHLIRSLKSSGTVMEKRVCFSKPTRQNPEGREFHWSWKSIARLRPTDYPRYVEKLIADGWELIHGQRKLKKNRADVAPAL